MDSQKINKKIEETLGSFDGAEKATPAPYLLTRINARLKAEDPASFWSQAFAFINRPLVAVAVLLLVILNVVVISQKENTHRSVVSQNVSTSDFAINVSSMYDVENQ